ncbi:arylsulfatase [Halosquirtibacter xylanolyticus]|uniref:arylsulfatase n=1 Tax=Halosquirtibacter xylanolyticus TaxID=3374599 RepID=UPI00374A351B|nr:arylsulfatase [Prolixibacteraceae bacterium]
MKKRRIFLGLLVPWLCCACNEQKREETVRPNIVYILADDLGYGDLGVYGQQKIETPNIDRLANSGIRFTQHYAGAPVCAPSRGVLLTGKHTGHAYIRGNDEWTSRGDVWNFEACEEDSTLEGQRALPSSERLLSQILHDAGYKTGMVGKWGLGAPHTQSIPTKKGFDFFYGYNCQRGAHTYYPVHLYKNENRVYLENRLVAPHSKLPKGSDPNNDASYADFNLVDYAPDLMFDEMIGFMESTPKDQPFFMYWASPIPHVPLQAPQRWVDYYRKKFGEEKPYVGKSGYFPVQYPRATYAAMISYLDERVGQLVSYLKRTGKYKNTLIIFASDNGATFNGGTQSEWFKSNGPFKNEYGWGKCFVHEGGIRVPMIASWPNHIEANRTTDLVSSFYDVLPTLCDVAQVESDDSLDGISFLPTLLGDVSEQKKHDYLYWEFTELDGEQAVRLGKWKAIRKNIKKGDMHVALYDLSNDIQELHDVSTSNPKVVKQMEEIMASEHQSPENDSFALPALEKL